MGPLIRHTAYDHVYWILRCGADMERRGMMQAIWFQRSAGAMRTGSEVTITWRVNAGHVEKSFWLFLRWSLCGQ